MSVPGPLTANERVSLPSIAAPASSRAGLATAAGLLVCGGLVALSAAHTTALLPESIRPVPSSLAGPLAGVDIDLHVSGVIGVLGLMFALYAVALAGCAAMSPRVVIGTIVGLHALMLLAPPLASTDVFSYQAYARMGAHWGISPYLNGPHAIDFDPVFPYVGAKWSYIPSAYGPAFTAFSYLLAPASVAASVVAYKSIATAASLGLIVVVWRAARLRGVDPPRAAAIVGLNPLLVVYGVGGGHNDLLMLLAMSGGIYVLLAGRARTAGALGVLAVGVKLTGGLVLPFALAAGGAGDRPVRCRRRELAVGVAVALLLLAGLSVALFGGASVHLLSTILQTQREGDWKSIPGAITARLHLPVLGRIVGGLLAAGFVLLTVRLLLFVWRGRLDWIDGAGWATLAMLVASSSLLPWYVAWLLPLAALARDERLRTTTIVMTGVVLAIQMLGYIPHGTPLL